MILTYNLLLFDHMELVVVTNVTTSVFIRALGSDEKGYVRTNMIYTQNIIMIWLKSFAAEAAKQICIIFIQPQGTNIIVCVSVPPFNVSLF